jgi:hypothetical protein
MTQRSEARETIHLAEPYRATRGSARRRVVASQPRDDGEPDICANVELGGSDATCDGANPSIALERRDVVAPLPREAATQRCDAAALQRVDLITTQEVRTHERIGEMNRTGILDLFAE